MMQLPTSALNRAGPIRCAGFTAERAGSFNKAVFQYSLKRIAAHACLPCFPWVGRCSKRRRPVASPDHQEAGNPSVHARPHAPGRRGACLAVALVVNSAFASSNDLMIVTRDDSCCTPYSRPTCSHSPPSPTCRSSRQVWDGGIDTLRTQIKLPTTTGIWSWSIRMSCPPVAAKACSRSLTGRRSAAKTTTCRRRSAIAAWAA